MHNTIDYTAIYKYIDSSMKFLSQMKLIRQQFVSIINQTRKFQLVCVNTNRTLNSIIRLLFAYFTFLVEQLILFQNKPN